MLKLHTMGLSEYGWNIFLQRKEDMNGLTRIVEDLKPQHPFRIGIIHALGDWITGEDTFPLQMSRLDKFIQEQVIDGMQHMADLVRYICTLFPKVILYGLPGNHTAGRGTTMNIDLLSYAFLKALLKDQENLFQKSIAGNMHFLMATQQKFTIADLIIAWIESYRKSLEQLDTYFIILLWPMHMNLQKL